MIKKCYILDRNHFKISEAYVEPEREWFNEIHPTRGKIRCYNDIDPETQKRTGGAYREEDIFLTKDSAKQGLYDYINNLIRENEEKIQHLLDYNGRLRYIAKHLG